MLQHEKKSENKSKLLNSTTFWQAAEDPTCYITDGKIMSLTSPVVDHGWYMALSSHNIQLSDRQHCDTKVPNFMQITVYLQTKLITCILWARILWTKYYYLLVSHSWGQHVLGLLCDLLPVSGTLCTSKTRHPGVSPFIPCWAVWVLWMIKSFYPFYLKTHECLESNWGVQVSGLMGNVESIIGPK